MFTKPLLLAVLVACGLPSTGATTEPPPEQPDKPPDEDVKENVYFCCKDVDHKTETGEDCVTIGEKQIDSCSTVLACETFTKKDGKVKCT